MSGLKKVAVVAALVLALCVALAAAQAQGPNKKVPVGPSKSIDPPSGQGDTHGVAHRVATLESEVAVLQGEVDNLIGAIHNLQARFANLSSTVGKIEANNALLLGKFVTVEDDPIDGVTGPNIIFTGANIHLRSGSVTNTTDDGGTLLGLGNLIIGYDEPPAGTSRGGSHNLVIGPKNNFSSFGGLVAGSNNNVSGADASVTGGENNTASGNNSVVVGGNGNSATAADSIKP